ncbi:glycosyltransferase [Desulfohalobium retbaense]|uniref:Glycosyl transferase group 1 n=1 Tax=Desulfohalobium retbaense (strain ATCC 49708 / DSM 5692 / JCM 16813 / HR100) TaxID=485915 RepID=C8X1P7_DESRD|nr:glycosyltransferase [Desulfohalobium retbaense]ACV68469.1 glycosyl transferase group 1 [Desulfohalobium retbaense DSM 5692]
MSSNNYGRILCLTSNFPRWEGDSTPLFILNLAKDLQSLGWTVDVLAPHAPGAAKKERIQGLQVERFQYWWPAVRQNICYQGGALVNLRKNKAVFSKLPFFLFFEWEALYHRLLSRKYDLVHSHWLLPQGFIGAMATRLAWVPHVVTIHGGDVFGLQQKIFTPFKRFALKQADTVTVNSSATQQAVESLTPGLKNVRRISMGVDLPEASQEDTKVQSLRREYKQGKGPLIVFVGRVVEEKGIEDLIRAVPLIVKKCLDVQVLVVGEGQDRPALEKLVSNLGLTDRISFTGWVKAEKVPTYLAAADVFVGPSRQASDGWVEAQGLTFLEAMSVGTPVVATRSGGIVDSVIHEQTGLLVEERSPSQIAEAVLRLVLDQALSQKLKTLGRKLVENEYSRGETVAQFSDIYRSLISKKVKQSQL